MIDEPNLKAHIQDNQIIVIDTAMKARYKTVVDELARAIRASELAPGSRLPTHRELAARHGISLATATRVYAELEAMGLVSGETGRGTFVREWALPAGIGGDQHAVASDVLDLNFNYPALPEQAELLRNGLKQLATTGDIESLLRYQPHAGRTADRQAFAAYLNGKGVACDEEEVLIVNGAQHGLAVTLMGLLQPGDVIAVDALTYPGFKVLAQQMHLELLAIPESAAAMDLDVLEKRCRLRRVKAVYTMPTLHNPMGRVMNEAWRRRLAEIARRYELLIIEDAAYAWLVEHAPKPLRHYAPEHTVYVSGFSKNIAARLRVGMVVSPRKKRAQTERAIRATTWNTPAILTSLVCSWLQDGTVLTLEALKRVDAQNRQALAREVFHGAGWQAHPNAYFGWIALDENIRAESVVSALLKERISVSTAEPFCTSLYIPHAIRLALGSVSMANLETGLKTVRDVIEYFTDL